MVQKEAKKKKKHPGTGKMKMGCTFIDHNSAFMTIYGE